MKKQSTPKPKARVVLVDDHPIVRELLGQLINQQDDLVVAGDCGDAADCVALLQRTPADLAIVDLSLGNSHGIDLIKDLHLQFPKLPVVVLSMHDEAAYVSAALRAGARGYVTKQDATQQILVAIKRVLAGEIFVSEKLAGQLVGLLLRGGAPAGVVNPAAQLSDRELQVFELIGRGWLTREIAQTLKISAKTVDSHRANLKVKLGTATIADLRAAAAQWVQRLSAS
jgi:DNA-binding NarL/FixJ family response regulator